MKKIKLSKNKECIVDDKHYQILNQYKWMVNQTKSGKYRAVRSKTINKKRTMIYMHRFIMELEGYNIKEKEIDHRNCNSLDNRLKNLRIATNAENKRNREKNKNNKNTYKGIRKRYNRWLSRIRIDNKEIYLGSFLSEIEAAKAYDMAAIKYHGEFANLNFP